MGAALAGGTARRAPAGGYAASAAPAAVVRIVSGLERPFPRLLERRRAVGGPHVVDGLYGMLRGVGQLGQQETHS
ncbi:hypothetical protein OG333_38450 (plasmid) [Streptomyces anulatus]|uniref:hypothetical protein n=1 Tax=Streptomyces anulatus TaxID=1892 RepID=UPI0037DC1B1B|nr:hypothetical protein OG333_38450 [Streptomyces anulatus]